MSATQRRTRIVIVFAGVVVSTLALAGPAFAHLESSPTTVTPGSTVKITFTAEHGCNGSPTTKLAIKLPVGVTAKKPVGPKGFVGSVTGNVITFDKGTLAPTVHGAFTAMLTFPKTKGLLAFPAVQTCVKGSTSWIELPVAGSTELAHPAPQIGVGVKGSVAD